jgi:hypothetical protein
MMDSASGSRRLLLRAREGAADGARLAGISKLVLGLPEQEAKRLWEKLPSEIVLAPMTEKERTRIEERLASCAIEVSSEPLRVSREACARHAKLGVSDPCPRCQDELACYACLNLSAIPACASCARSAARRTKLRRIRIGILLSILVAVAVTTYTEQRRITSWNQTLRVRVYPIDGDGSEVAARYVAGLGAQELEAIGSFFAKQAERYGIEVHPVIELSLGTPLAQLPPLPPKPEERTIWSVAAWSLRLRYWIFRTVPRSESPDVRILALYYAPELGLELEHSIGLAKGRVGIAHLFAGTQAVDSNAIVVAHEILHALGATDKYDDNEQPVFPDGYADDSRRYPQSSAEIMAGRIPVSPSQLRTPASLAECAVAKKTATEIGWASR